ncbi:Rieske 2Fe-2S domain-containing protein [Actinoplanes sp. NPDC023714]|uniref:Rieske (2Fe-2S) protein n=1 Tax=Actinoplanes sp. NPDC023714 TaxID=3154322 RepID=UPI00340C3861
MKTAVVLGSLHDIPLGEGRSYAVDGQMIAVFRLRDGSLRAVDAVCPHQGGPLADGQIDNKVVVCPLHLFAWDLATGCSQSGQPPLTVYPVRADGDQIILGE